MTGRFAGRFFPFVFSRSLASLRNLSILQKERLFEVNLRQFSYIFWQTRSNYLTQNHSISSQRSSRVATYRHSGFGDEGSQFKWWDQKINWCIAGCFGLVFILPQKTVKAAELEPKELQLDKIDKSEEQKVIREADALYSQDQVDTLYEFLKRYDNVESAQISWRLARAACDKAKNCGVKSEERKFFMHEGFCYAERSIALEDKCAACHRWYAVMLNYVGDYEGNKQKIKYSYIVREHFEKAIELNPEDATSMYCIGQWCYFFADLSWYTQKIAALIFGTPPHSTFEEALSYFDEAERTDPNFYSMNHLMLAKTYLKLNNKVKAKEHLVTARDLPIKSPDDTQAHAEALELLGQI